MSESQAEYQKDDPVGISYEVITFNLNDKSLVRNAVLVTATAILTKTVMNVAGRQLSNVLGGLARKFKMRAIDEAHKMAEVKEHEREEELAGEGS